MHLKTAQQQIGLLMREHGLLDTGWTQVTDRAKNRLGQCRYVKRQLSFSEDFLRLNEWDTIRGVALHEIAHALVGPGHGHDVVWRQRARSIGCPPEVCSSTAPAITAPAKYTGTCPRCATTVTCHRMTHKTHGKACAACCNRYNSGRFTDEFLFVWRETSSIRLTTTERSDKVLV